MNKAVKILLTGSPGCGKTTAVMKIVEALSDIVTVGFYTEEIIAGGKRTGFRWKRLDGREGILAHVDIKSGVSVGRFRVDVPAFEDGVVTVLDLQRSTADLFVIDEIGKMECLSKSFVWVVRKLLNSPNSVLATVAQKGTELMDEVKHRADTQLLVVNHQNMDAIVSQVVDLVRGSLG